MAINVSVQHNGGFLPDIILLTQRYYHRGTRLKAIKRFCICSLRSHLLNVLTFPPLTGRCSESLARFVQIFLETTVVVYIPSLILFLIFVLASLHGD